MTIVEEYRTRIRQADSLEQKKELAAELHRLADSFDESQKMAYELAMHELQRDIARQLEAMEPAAQRAEVILNRYSAAAKS